MFDAHNYLKKNKKNCFLLADQQSKGRGQRGKNWHSPVGNIYCSISFDNFLDINEHFLFSILISISIRTTLEKFNAKNINFKWPNDIFYKSNKFAGMISEITDIDKKNSHIIVGLGINFVSAPEIKNYNTTYLRSFCNIKSINEFLIVFIEVLFLNLEEIRREGKNMLIKRFSKYLMFVDEKIKITLPNDLIKEGIFRGVNDDGSLQLEINKEIKNIYNGRIEL